MPAVPRLGDSVEIEDFHLIVDAVHWTPDSDDEDAVVVLL
jgi:hypothetical protein